MKRAWDSQSCTGAPTLPPEKKQRVESDATQSSEPTINLHNEQKRGDRWHLSSVTADGLLSYLRTREYSSGPSKALNRSVYRFVTPQATVRQVKVPDVSFRKFTPDGMNMVAFSMNQHAVQLLRYKGPGGAKTKPPHGGLTGAMPRETAFDSFFESSHEVILTAGTELLCKDFCMFDSTGTLMILASARPALGGHASQPLFPTSLSSIIDLDDVSFWLVDITAGKLLDKITYSGDFILLANHAGVAINDDVLAITSVQNQCIFLGRSSFVSIRTVGWHNFEDDGFLIEAAKNSEKAFVEHHLPASIRGDILPNPTAIMEGQNILSGIRQRLMAFLYRRAKEIGTTRALNHFNLTFDQFSSLIMWRAQFLDKEHLLIKLGSADNVLDRNSEPNHSQSYFFMVYSLNTTNVVGFYENTSLEVLDFLEKMPGSYSAPRINHSQDVITNQFNNVYAKESMLRLFHSVRKAKNGGYAYASKRLLATFPVSSQCLSESPYFDHRLFYYDEKIITHHERIRPCLEFPVKFWDRETGKLLFKVDPNPYEMNGTSAEGNEGSRLAR
ncbi:acid phosphatase det1 [Dinochytrium kinnereticum]|nr:acid phosphatase det1 [Dinochytrium kinnereticum]